VQSHDAMIQNIQQEVNRATNNDDPRTQTNCADANTSSALDTLRLLKPKTFEYVDTINNTGQTVYGFDTNQVKQVVPYATRTTKEKIPNIYQNASVIGNKIIFTNFDTSNLLKNDSNNVYNELTILDANNAPHTVIITNILNNYILEVNTNLQSYVRENTDSTEGSSNNLVFVYGQIVDDFQAISKEHIYSITTAALQELDKQLQEEKTKNVNLIHNIDNTNLLKNQLEEQTKQTNLLEEQLSALETKINKEVNKRIELETKLDTYVEIMNSLLINK